MKATLATVKYRALREQPMWKLLGADRAPLIIALLQSVFTDSDKVLPGSALNERLSRELPELRAIGEDLGQAPAAAVQEWLTKGWLSRSLPAGASEEVYELSVDALAAMRFITGALAPKTTTTESRLSLVIQGLAQLATATDADPQARLNELYARRDRIDQDIQDIHRNGVTVMSSERALEHARGIISLAEELTSDFRAVRHQFEQLSRSLRQSLVEHEGSRGHVLGALFEGVDVIAESEAGKTFNGFWSVLLDLEQSESLSDSLESLQRRDFAGALAPFERRFLANLTSTLLDEGSSVHDVMRNLAAGLKQFVKSREFLEQRRMHGLLREATQAALAARVAVRPRSMEYQLQLTSCAISSLSRHPMYDPEQQAPAGPMEFNQQSELSMADIARHIREAGIDMRALKRNVLHVLEERSQASISQVLEVFPANQGLGTIYGYLDLGVRHAQRTEGCEYVSWSTSKGLPRRAKVPELVFLRERSSGLKV